MIILKYGFKIACFFFFFLACISVNGQIEKGLIPHFNKLLLNPSYAGQNRDTHIWNSLLFSSPQEKHLDNSFSLTYDTWSEKMQGGVALYFYQGLTGEVNTNTTGIGFSFSKPYESGKNSEIIPSVNLSTHAATKQWFVHVVDRMLDKETEPPSSPGEEFSRYTFFRPGFGLLLNSPYSEMGISGWYSFFQNPVNEEETNQQDPFQLVFHFVQKMRGNRKGLISEPVKASPELTVLFSEYLILSRMGLRMERTNHMLGFFIQNNFNSNLHGIAGFAGLKFQNFRVSGLAGGTYSIPNNKPGFFGEISLGLIIPYVHINENFPWAPPSRSF